MAIIQSLDKLLRSSIKKYQVPGASLAVLRNNKLLVNSCAGVVNIDTGVKVTTDSTFQIGSITKPHTATLVMQLVDEGLIELDAPIRTYLPEFRTENLDYSNRVTVRHLLSHTSGIDGDYFIDSGRGDDAIETFILQCRMVPSLFAPGEMMSYCNLGYCVLGRLIEVMRRKSYDQALIDHLFNPLGMRHAFSRPEDALRFNAAIGHVKSNRKANTWYPSKIPYLSLGQKAAGSTPSMSATDLLKFAQLHLHHGLAQTGERLLKSATSRQMQRRQIRLPKHSSLGLTGWGLGWFLMNWQGEKLYGHDGATIGQFAFLRVVPSKNLAVVLLTNGGDAKGLCQAVVNPLISHYCKIEEPQLPAPTAKQPDLTNYAGQFENMTNRIVLSRHQDQLTIQEFNKDAGKPIYPKQTPITFIDKHTARIAVEDPVLDRTRILFTENRQGLPGYLQIGYRQYRRSGSE